MPLTLSICTNIEGRFVDGNRAGEELVGCAAKLIGKSFLESSLLSQETLAKARELLAQSARGQATGPEEITLNRKDGGRRTVEVRAYPIQVRGQVLVLGIARDITERKRAEEQLLESREQLRALAGRLQTVREEERARLAREIHDVLAQELTLLELDCQWLRRRLSQPVDEEGRRALKEETDKMVEAIDRAMESVQRVATEIPSRCARHPWAVRRYRMAGQRFPGPRPNRLPGGRAGRASCPGPGAFDGVVSHLSGGPGECGSARSRHPGASPFGAPTRGDCADGAGQWLRHSGAQAGGPSFGSGSGECANGRCCWAAIAKSPAWRGRGPPSKCGCRCRPAGPKTRRYERHSHC